MEIIIYRNKTALAEARGTYRKTKRPWIVPAIRDWKKIGYVDLHEFLWIPTQQSK